MIGYKNMLHKSFTIDTKKKFSIMATPPLPPTPPSSKMIKIAIIITFIALFNRKKTK